MDQQTYMYSLVEEWKSYEGSKSKFLADKSVHVHVFNYWLKKYNKAKGLSNVSFFSVEPPPKPVKSEMPEPKKERKLMSFEFPSGLKITIY